MQKNKTTIHIRIFKNKTSILKSDNRDLELLWDPRPETQDLSQRWDLETKKRYPKSRNQDPRSKAQDTCHTSDLKSRTLMKRVNKMNLQRKNHRPKICDFKKKFYLLSLRQLNLSNFQSRILPKCRLINFAYQAPILNNTGVKFSPIILGKIAQPFLFLLL